MNRHCPACAAPLPDVAPAHIGSVPYCSEACVTAWFADGRHSRRHTSDPIVVERRQA